MKKLRDTAKLMMIALIILVLAGCQDNDIENALFVLSEKPETKIYSPHGDNYLQVVDVWPEGEGQPELQIYLNDSEEPSAYAVQNEEIYLHYGQCVFWLDNEHIFYDGDKIYNMATGETAIVPIPQEYINEYVRPYAVPSSDGSKIAYQFIFETEESLPDDLTNSVMGLTKVGIYDTSIGLWSYYDFEEEALGWFPSRGLVWLRKDSLYINRASDSITVLNLNDGSSRDLGISGNISSAPVIGRFFSVSSYDSLTDELQLYFIDIETGDVVKEDSQIFHECWSDSNTVAYIDVDTNDLVVFDLAERVEIARASCEEIDLIDIVFAKGQFYVCDRDMDYYLISY